ncbi:MAG TPA: hypothetical protein VG406_27555 [Isosphaeraceae bacterium]|nr:hypothetical protein [Isosphaeraceae bacterium]
MRPVARKTTRSGDPDDPKWRAVELAQRGRMILDVAAADLEVAERRLGPFHPTSWHFRQALAEARKAWDRLRADLGSAALEAALEEPPVATLELSETAVLIPIGGRTYRVERLGPTELAEALWRLTRLTPPVAPPFYVAKLRDGRRHCDCAEWSYRDEPPDGPPAPCKHLAALEALGWP